IDSRLDATVRVITPAGIELAESRDVFGADPFLDFTLPVDGRYVIKLHDATYSGSPDHLYRLTLHNGPHLDAIMPLAFVPGACTPLTVIGRQFGACAMREARRTSDGLPFEISRDSITDAGDRSLDPSFPCAAWMLVPSAAAVTRWGFEYARVRINV